MGTTYAPPQASAQVKSAVLLAGLYAEGETRVVEKVPTRDHTERMLRHFGVGVGVRGNEVSVSRAAPFRAADVEVPSDISSAAFFMVAAAINPGSEVLVRNVGVNPLRAGVLDVLREMGADISEENRREVCGEPVADLVARYAPLRATRVDGDLVSRAIDELPAVAVAACFAGGETVITGAGELRVKESDRISAMVGELRALGADVEELPDGNGDKRGGRRPGRAVPLSRRPQGLHVACGRGHAGAGGDGRRGRGVRGRFVSRVFRDLLRPRKQGMSADDNIITIDGPAGVGKSTVSRLVADALGFFCLDTGAMYRAVALKAAATGTDFRDPAALEAMLRETTVGFFRRRRGFFSTPATCRAR